MALILQKPGGKQLRVVRDKAAFLASDAPDKKTMSDSVRGYCNSAAASALAVMRKAMKCSPDDAGHKAVIDSAKDAITACSIAAQDCAYYGSASAAESVASSAAAAESLRVLMAACDGAKADCGTCSNHMQAASDCAEAAAKTCEANAGIDTSEEPDADDTGEMAAKQFKRFDMDFDISTKTGVSYDVIKQGDQIVDYQNVKLIGYLSTFKNVTAKDRDGDYVEPGAFRDSLPDFKKNPVMLRDHINLTSHLAGSFTSVEEDSNGLRVEGLLSNAPDCRDVRFKVAEGHLKTLSMGGVFRYGEDGAQIKTVRLFEGSLTPVPANQDARFRVRSLNAQEIKFLKAGKKYPSFFHFLLAQERLQNARGVAA